MKTVHSLLGGLVASIALAGSAAAGQLTDMQFYDGTSGSPIVTINYSNPNDTGTHTIETYADPQVSGGTASPLFYCVDLWHDNNLGATYTITPVSRISFSETSTFSDADNRIAWLLSQPQATADERGAVQLAIWYTIDNKAGAHFSGFSFTGGDAALVSDYDSLISFAGYNPDVAYSAQFWAAKHDPCNTLYQNLVSDAAVPEPGSGLLAVVGLFAGAGLSIRRRPRSMSAAS